MKLQLFRGMGHLLVSSLIVLTPAAVSCNISELDDRITDLENRVDELAADIQDQISSIQGMLEENVSVVSCVLDEETGIYTIVLSSGETIEVSKAGSEASSVIGVMEENGEYYWTLDGEPMLDDGNKVPVSVTPGIRVNPDTDMWEVSPDGSSWLDTGIKAVDGASIFSKVDEDESYVYFTLGDGSSIKVAKLTDFECSVFAGKQYVSAGQTIELELTLKNAVKTAVMKPDGWKASVDGNILSITAPSADNPYAETEGKVSVLAVSSSKEFSMCEVAVEVGEAPHVITIGPDMSISITNSYDPWGDDYLWNGFYYGVSLLEDFSPETLAENLLSDTRALFSTEPIGNKPLESLVEYDEKQSYVVWCLDSWFADEYFTELEPLDPNDIIFEVIEGKGVEMQVSDITFENATVNVNVSGVSSYYAAVFDKDSFNATNVLDNLNAGSSAVGDLYSILDDDFSGQLTEFGAPENDYGEIMPNELFPGTTYVLMVVPIKNSGTYTEEDIYTVEAELPAIKFGGSLKVELSDITSDYTSVSAIVTPSEGFYKYYVTYLAEDKIGGYESDEVMVEYLMEQTARTDASYKFTKTGLAAGEKGYIVAVAIDKDGNAGEVLRQEVTSASISYNDIEVTLTTDHVGITDATISLSGKGVVSYRYLYTNENGLKMYPFGTYAGGRDDAQIEQVLAMDSYSYNTKYINEVGADGAAEINLSNLNSQMAYYVFVVGIDSEGNPTHLASCDFKTVSVRAIYAAEGSDRYNANYEANRPKISNVKINNTGIGEMSALPSDYSLPISYDVEVGDKCGRYWLSFQNPNYITIDPDFPDETALAIMSDSRAEVYSDPQTATGVEHPGIYNKGFDNMYLVWEDDEGYIYPPEIVELSSILLSDVFAAEGSDKYNANYEANRPKITVKINGKAISEYTALPDNPTDGSGPYRFSFDVTAGSQCARYWVSFQNPAASGVDPDDAYPNRIVADILADSRLQAYDGTTSATDVEYGTDSGFYYDKTYSVMYVIWQDAEGYYYPAEIIDLNDLLGK